MIIDRHHIFTYWRTRYKSAQTNRTIIFFKKKWQKNLHNSQKVSNFATANGKQHNTSQEFATANCLMV